MCPLLNIGYGRDITIREIAGLVREIVGFRGEIAWDATKPDGMPLKLLDSTRIRNAGWEPRISLREGIALAYGQYLGTLEH